VKGLLTSLPSGRSVETLQLERLSPTVRSDYIECLDEKRREDEHEARQDQVIDDAGT